MNSESYELKKPSVENPERCKDVDIPDESSEDLMWFLGFYLGDGFVKYEETDKKRVSIAVSDDQEELRQEIIDTAEELFNTEVSR
jgi:hypothetical protein